MNDLEFVVYDQDRKAYVESIDTFDGSTEWTTDPRHARIFRGIEWEEHWHEYGATIVHRVAGSVAS